MVESTKMTKTFLIADNHFGHKNIVNFTSSDGSKLRDFESSEEMDEHMVDRWNATVSPSDRVYMLGDMVIKRSSIPILGRLKGRKILVRGNHDIFKMNDYAPYVDDIVAIRKLDNYYLTHVPIHPDSIPHWCSGNIHGHLHSGRVKYQEEKSYLWGQIKISRTKIDPRYKCVSVEHLKDYAPVNFEEIRAGRF